MIAKIPVLGFAVVTALTGTAAAHEDYHGQNRHPTHYAPAGYHASGEYNVPRPSAVPYRNGAGYYQNVEELRRSDYNRDGRVTLAEAIDHGRRDFFRSDRDRNRVLTPRELSPGELVREDRNRDGRVSFREHEAALRTTFARLDVNRDGVVGRYEQAGSGRATGWRR
jgi:hypothetical protein